MPELLTATYGYEFNNIVQVRVASTNSAGLSGYAYNLNGAAVRTVPGKMNTPVLVSYSDTFINLNWAPLTGTSTGNSPITSYVLYWNAGVGTDITIANTAVIDSLITSY